MGYKLTGRPLWSMSAPGKAHLSSVHLSPACTARKAVRAPLGLQTPDVPTEDPENRGDRGVPLEGASHRSMGKRVLGKKLYVGNLPFTATENELQQLFEKHGSVESVAIIMDRETGRPRGFAFVEMADSNGAAAAMQALDGREFGGRALRVNEANERPQGGGRSGGYGGNRRR